MTTQQLEAETACVSAPPRYPNCGEAVLTEVMENLADLAVQKERQLLKRALDAHEQDQQSLARQVHEGLAQHMIGALLRLRAVEQRQQGDPEGQQMSFTPLVGEDCFGLQEVRERAKLLGGRTAIDSAPGKGTRVVVELPLENNAPSEI